MSTDDAIVERLRAASSSVDSSVRLQAALTAGTRPDPRFVDVLIQRCAIEPDFYVRDMLTWALTRHPPDITVPPLLDEVRTGAAQARSQALHSLSKIRDPRGWDALTPELLQDDDEQVARTAWRAAVVLVPEGGALDLARTLATQLARGDRELRLSLSRAFVDLGDVASPVLADAAASTDAEVRTHAIATGRLMLDPDEGFDAAVFEAKRHVALSDAPMPPPPPPSEGN